MHPYRRGNTGSQNRGPPRPGSQQRGPQQQRNGREDGRFCVFCNTFMPNQAHHKNGEF